MKHWHHCPECYDKWACIENCFLEPDQDDPVSYPGESFGAIITCPMCDKKTFDKEFFTIYNGLDRKPKVYGSSKLNNYILFSKEWWEFYNGLRRN